MKELDKLNETGKVCDNLTILNKSLIKLNIPVRIIEPVTESFNNIYLRSSLNKDNME